MGWLGLPAPAGVEEFSPLVLAYIGDAVYELYVRSYLAYQGNGAGAGLLHREAVGYVNAATQARLAREMEGYLTAGEKTIVKRGRNARSTHVPPGVGTALDYRFSTGLECLFGSLFLKGEEERLGELLALACTLVGGEK